MNGRLEKEEKFYQKIEKKLNTLPPIFKEYYISMRANRKSYTTINVYINNLLHFARFISQDNIANDFYKYILPSNIENYMISLETRNTKDGVRRTGDDILQARWSSLNHFFNWLVARGYISTNPVNIVERPKNQTEHRITYLSKVEINKLFRAIDRNNNHIMALRDKTIISLALATALRVGALVNINVEDIDFENNVINVVEKRKKIREIHIGKNIVEILSQWIEVRNSVFSDITTSALFVSRKKSRLSGDAIGDMLTKYCANANIKRITPHKLRATAACALAKNNIPIKAIAQQLGHNNISTTMRYIDVFNEDSQKALGILDNLF